MLFANADRNLNIELNSFLAQQSSVWQVLCDKVAAWL